MKRVMYSLIALGFVLLFVSATSAMAQDPVKVGPHVYKCIFENERVRVCEVRFKPGDTIGVHSHPDHFVYVQAPGKMRITPKGGQPAEIDFKVGEVVFIPAEAHSGVNIGKTETRALVVELKESMDPVQSELARIGKKWARAMIDADTATLDQILADEWVVTAPNGQLMSKAQFLSEMRSGALDFQSTTAEDVEIKVFGDTAIVTGRSQDRVTYKGQDISGPVRWTDVFIKRDGKWEAVSTHVTMVAPQ